MQPGLRVGSLFGIPLYLHPSWFYIFVLLTWLYSAMYASEMQVSGLLALGIGLVISMGLFGSVLLHELGHSLVARSQGIKVNSITLFLFGGIASIDQESKTPGQAFQVAIAGPAVSLLLSVLLIGLASAVNPNSILAKVAIQLGLINQVLSFFNLIPGLPLDGGQMLKAVVWKLTGDRFKGVHWAARMGLILGWTAILLGSLTFFLTGFQGLQGLWIALLGWFGVQNATTYDRFADLQEALVRIKAADAMSREFRVVDANITLRQFADDYLLAETHYPIYFAASEGRYRGLVSIDNLRAVERSQWEHQTLHTIAQPLTEIDFVQEKTPLLDVINQMEAKQLRRITVLSPAGTVAGVIDRGDIVRTVTTYLKSAVSEADIRRIKEEGTYPPGLPLQAIAKATADWSET